MASEANLWADVTRGSQSRSCQGFGMPFGELWQDAVPQFGACWAFAVRPQPLAELQASRAWILVVEIAPVKQLRLVTVLCS